MELADILAAGSVLYCKDVSNKSQLFDRLAQAGSDATSTSKDIILAAISGREDLGSTGLGDGIAIPHGKIRGLSGVSAVFARLAEPIDFDAVDDLPVDVVMMLLAPVGAGADHLKALSRVARLLRTDAVVNDIRACEDPVRLHAILTARMESNYAA